MSLRASFLAALLCATFLFADRPSSAGEMPWVVVSPDKTGFILESSGQPFVPWGFNYDHDAAGRLIEDYWEAEWPTVESHFAQIQKLGANVVRIHLQLGKFMDGPDRPNKTALDRLAKLLTLAEKEGLYLDLTGLGCYHKPDVPAWYDKLGERARWDVQARFWKAVARTCAKSSAVFCYDLMNEPVVPGGKRAAGEWLGPAFAGKHFVQFITLDQQDRPRPEVARAWVQHLCKAIREEDQRHLVTVGLVDWSLDRPGLSSGFVPQNIAGALDFLCVHLYPEAGKLEAALQTLAGFSVGLPVVIEETFPLKCSLDEFAQFIQRSEQHACGWIGFYWGQPPEELRRSTQIKDALLLAWLDFFETKRPRTQAELATQIDKLEQLGAKLTRDDQHRVIGAHLGERKVTDADLVHLRGLHHLQELDLTRTKITSAGLKHVADLAALRKLYLTDTKVDDSGMAHLKRLKHLGFVGLSGTGITDAGLYQLRELPALKEVFCLGTSVTDAGVEKLQRALPQCEVTY